jgi:hypothetical protein
MHIKFLQRKCLENVHLEGREGDSGIILRRNR